MELPVGLMAALGFRRSVALITPRSLRKALDSIERGFDPKMGLHDHSNHVYDDSLAKWMQGRISVYLDSEGHDSHKTTHLQSFIHEEEIALPSGWDHDHFDDRVVVSRRWRRLSYASLTSWYFVWTSPCCPCAALRVWMMRSRLLLAGSSGLDEAGVEEGRKLT